MFYKNIPIVFSFIGIFCACFLNKFVLLHLISAVSCKTSTTSWKQLIKYPQTLIMYIWFLNKK